MFWRINLRNITSRPKPADQEIFLANEIFEKAAIPDLRIY